MFQLNLVQFKKATGPSPVKTYALASAVQLRQLIPQTNVENENEEAEQLITHELDEISCPSVLVIYEAMENEADNSAQLTSPPQPQTPIAPQTAGENDQHLASVNTLYTPIPRFTRFLRREEEPDSRRSTPTMVD